ncbi:hypothetical protein [Spirosoma foliorum]|uniref:IPT/TIG domain-containing protein n=1 Tax=Spirosoma foliorum TaxID=2710596 RepID=A0A7G5H2R8_9BACT|nr:hypothetical protein [Spirosoma foliorum]QMW05410.1 hypothetical protein H3H32_11210 [Spirosoma foliorum]
MPIKPFIFALLVILAGACNQSTLETQPDSFAPSSKQPQTLFEGNLLAGLGSTTGGSARSAAPAPVINQLRGTSCDECPPSMPATSVPVDYVRNQIIIEGANFGTATGKAITIMPTSGTQSSYQFSFFSWSNRQIVLGAVSTVSAVPLSFRVTVTIADGQTVSTTFTALPIINGRYYQSSIWYVNKRRVELGLAVQPRGYAFTGPLGNDYTPTRGDSWLHSTANHSVVTSVSTRVQLISQDRAGKTETVTYSVINEEMINGRVTTSSRAIEYRRLTTNFTNAPARVTNTLVTPPGTAFRSTSSSIPAASRFYR